MNKRTIAIAMMLALCGGVSTVAAQEATTPPDNTGINVRDQSETAMTASSQSNSKPDVQLAARIRRAVTRDSSLSIDAQNVKIITMNGQVTLRGPVKSDAEKANIASKAEAIAGAGNVNNQLEVAGQ